MNLRRWRKPLAVTPLSRLGERVEEIRTSDPGAKIVALMYREHPTEVAAVYPHVQRVASELRKRGYHAIPVKISLKDTNYQIVRDYARVIARHHEGKATDEERQLAKEEAAKRLMELEDSIVRTKKIADEHEIHAVNFHATPYYLYTLLPQAGKWKVWQQKYNAVVIEVNRNNKQIRRRNCVEIAVNDLKEYAQEKDRESILGYTEEGLSVSSSLIDEYQYSTAKRKRNFYARAISSKVSNEIADWIHTWISGKEKSKFKKLLSRFRAN